MKKSIYILLSLIIIIYIKGHAEANIVNLSYVNTPAFEDTPVISQNGKILFFNSSRSITDVENTSRYDYLEKIVRNDFNIFYCINNGESWSTPLPLDKNINSVNDDGIISISKNGKTIYFLSFKEGYEYDGGPFYKGDINSLELTNIRGLGGELTNFFENNDCKVYSVNEEIFCGKYIAGASISSDETELYFSTDINHEFGSFDIWISYFQNGSWTNPINLGSSINTVKAINKEPFISEDKSTLYFSSNAKGGYGGFDIYYCSKDKDGWSKPQNIGEEINSEFDENQFSISSSDKKIYFTSNRNKKEHSVDIYALRYEKSNTKDTIVIDNSDFIVDDNLNIVLNQDFNVQVYPNPVNDIVSVCLDCYEESLTLSLKLINGITSQLMYSKELVNITKECLDIKMQEFPKGIYFLLVSDYSKNERLVKILKY